jgi:hypothetical protein
MPLFLLPVLGAAKSAFGWLLKNPLWLLIVGLAVVVGLQTLRLNHAKHDLAVARSNLATCATNTRLLQSAVDTQNAAVRAQAAADAKATADATAALARIRGGAAGVAKRIATIAAATPGSDPCQAARALILASLKP